MIRILSKKRTTKWNWIGLLFFLIFINIIGANIHSRFDLTNEKRFTISSPVKKLITNVPDIITVDVFLNGELPAAFKGIANYTDDLLHEFQEIGGAKFKFRFINPVETMEGSDRTYEDTLRSLNITPINLKVQLKSGEESQFVFPAALVHYHEKTIPVVLYEGNRSNLSYTEYYRDINSAEALMEFKFADAISKLTETVRPMIGYVAGNGEPTGVNVYDLVENVLKKNYNLKIVDLNKQAFIPDTFKLLMVIKPTIPFSDSEKLKLDQYVMRGGKMIWMIDKLNAEMDSLQQKNQVIAFDRNLNLEDLFFKYGVRINSDLIMDLQCDYLPFNVNGKSQFEFLHWNYFPLFETNSNHQINKNLGLIAGRFVNSIDTVRADGIKKTILLSSSPNSRTISTPALISGAENRNAPEDEAFKRKNIPAAVLLEGKFTSLYANRIGRSQMDSLYALHTPFLPSGITANKMIIVADGDIPLNGITRNNPIPMGMNSYTVGTQYEYQFANREFVENCLDYLINDNGLSESKSKDYTLRLLDPKRVNDEKSFWQLLNIIIPILIMALFGFIYQFWRKRRYTIK